MKKIRQIPVDAMCALLAFFVLAGCGSGSASSGCVNATGQLTLTPHGRQVVVGNSVTLSASGGTAPYTYAVVAGSGSVNSSGVYTASSTTGSVQVRATDATGCNTGDATVTVRAATAKIFLELDRSAGVTSTVLGLNYDYATGVASQIGSGTLDSHSVCQLRDGTLIGGDYRVASQGQMWEFSSTGANQNRQVYTSTRTGNGAMSFCDPHPTDDTTVVIMDAPANTGIGGEIVKVTLSGGSWGNAVKSGDFATFGGSTNTFTWAMETHTDGYVYTLPYQRNVAQYQKMIRCPLNNLSACEGVGATNIPDTTLCTGPARVANAGSLVQLPGSDDMILTISPNNAACGLGRVYRYNYSSGTYTHIASIRATAGADASAPIFVIPNFMWMRTAIVQ